MRLHDTMSEISEDGLSKPNISYSYVPNFLSTTQQNVLRLLMFAGDGVGVVGRNIMREQRQSAII